MSLTYGTVCSGIEAPSCAVDPLGWKPLWFSEIEPFPKAVLAHRHPGVPDLGDMTTLPARILAGEVPAPDVFIGGTPCQSFSVAGLRKGLADPRGQLTRTFVEILDAIDTVRLARGEPPCVALWENVPGVLSDKDNAFGNFLAALVGEDEPLLPAGPRWTNAGSVLGPGRSLAWRVLDAQYFGVAQRRRRVFVVVSARAGGVDPVEVLLVEPGVRRDTPPSREAWQGPSAPAARGAASGGGERGAGDDGGRERGVMEDVAQPLRSNPYNNSDPLMEARMHIVERVVGGAVAHVDCMPTMVSGGSTDASHSQLSGQLREQYIVPHVVAPPLTATNDPSRSPQSSEVTQQVEAVLRATYANAGHFGTMREVFVSDPLRAKGGDTGNGGETVVAQGISGDVSGTLRATYPELADVVGTLSDGAHNGGGLNGQDAYTGRIFPVVTDALRAQNWDGQDTAPTLTGRLYGGLGAQTMPDKGNMGAVLQPVVMAHGQANAEVRTDGATPTLVCVHEAPIVALSPVVPYDLFQITAPINRQNRDERSPCHTLARDNAAHAAVVQSATFTAPAIGTFARSEVSGTLMKHNGAGPGETQNPAFVVWTGDGVVADPISAHEGSTYTHEGSTFRLHNCVQARMSVRRLTPVECERLQGFPDGHTAIPWKGKPATDCPDGPRYRALGNSMAVPVIAWIARKITGARG
jgi:site-specific DNA-cytosine methylase